MTSLRKEENRIKCLELERETEKQEREDISNYTLNETTGEPVDSWKPWHRWKSGKETKT
jgi:hypothetical protein